MAEIRQLRLRRRKRPAAEGITAEELAVLMGETKSRPTNQGSSEAGRGKNQNGPPRPDHPKD